MLFSVADPNPLLPTFEANYKSTACHLALLKKHLPLKLLYTSTTGKSEQSKQSVIMAQSAEEFAYLVNHIVLPPQLLAQNGTSHEERLLDIAINALQDLKGFMAHSDKRSVDLAIITTGNISRHRDSNGRLRESEILKSLDAMARSATETVIPLQFNIQNAALLVHRQAHGVAFEAFELSPKNEDVMACDGRLIRSFPAFVSTIPIKRMKENGFTKSLATAMTKLSVQAAPDFQSDRANTTHPGLITDYFVKVLAALGEPGDAARITKHTREEILAEVGGIPWRRSPLWLLVRVTVQLIFRWTEASVANSDELYKAFAILVLSRLLHTAKDSWLNFGTDALHAIISKTCRKIHKFEQKGTPRILQSDWSQETKGQLLGTYEILSAIWQDNTESKKANIDEDILLGLKADADLDMSLPQLDAFLLSINSSQRNAATSQSLHLYEYPVFGEEEVPSGFDDPEGNNQIHRLAAVEK